MKHTRHQSGFTAVELLITLFVAAAFLIAGFQLFNVVIRDGGNTRAESRAANIAYDYLRRYSATATNPCRAATPLVASPLDVSGLSNVSISVAISCPPYSTANISKVEVSIHYNTPQKTVKYATYSTGTDTPSDATLIGWWALNGNGNDQSGYSYNGSVNNGASAVADKNGQRDSALSFDGVDDSITTSGTSALIGNLTNNFTVSAWIYPTNLSASQPIFMTSRASSANGIAFMTWSGGTLRLTTYGVKDYTSATTSLSTNTWQHIVAVMNANNVTFYVDGEQKDTITHSTGGLANTDDHNMIGVSYTNGTTTPSSYFSGSIDDVRIYSRVLTADEIASLYKAGPY